ncbi:MAG: putative 2OG-Fe(II) oxygenase [Opitutales bacterium]
MKTEPERYFYAGCQVVRFRLPGHEELTTRLLYEMNAWREAFSFSHKINGRWENIYLSIDKVPSVREVVRPAREVVVEEFGQKLLALYEVPEGFPNKPFWFNLAKPGELTGVHDHARDASVSGVFHVQIPPDSGALFFRVDGEEDLLLEPVEGTVVLFPSTLRHGVRENRSSKERISLAFNLFTFPLRITHNEPYGVDRLCEIGLQTL